MPDLAGQPVTVLKGVGPSLAEKLGKLGVRRVADLIWLLPLRYEDRTKIVPLGALRPGVRALVEAEVALTEVVFRRRRTLLCRVTDGTGQLTLRFFYFSKAQQSRLVRGARIRCFGEVRSGPNGFEIVHPEYQFVGKEAREPAQRLTPIYPTTDGVGQQRLRMLVQQALAGSRSTFVAAGIDDLVEDVDMAAALKFLHAPDADADLVRLEEGLHPYQRRLALEELVAQRLSLLGLRTQQRTGTATAVVGRDEVAAFLSTLPFRLTAAQERVLEEIQTDLAQPQPMLRLVQGDVGSGKTVIAAAAAVAAAASGLQSAIMAPTELLAEQHLHNFIDWLEPLGLRVGWLTGSVTGANRRAVLGEIASGSADIVVGTHALFQEGVEFRQLGLAVVDEQHRFGVQQRLALQKKGETDEIWPHQLIMTATPIPRTLAMTAYADLDVSVIDELPPGRQPVTTVVMPEQRRPDLVQRVRQSCSEGSQAYWVCPLIEESENLDSQAAQELYRELQQALPELSIGLVHGRMKSAEKERQMGKFKAGDYQVLVATTVIEVGVDVPNARLMVIENAERMGLSQLHQLRGRVGRGGGESTCVLLYKPPLTQTARTRLGVMRDTQDGFVVAEKDLELRGPGEVLGTRQTGLAQLRIADLSRDADLVPQAVELGETLLRRYPERIEPLLERWVRGAEEYSKV